MEPLPDPQQDSPQSLPTDPTITKQPPVMDVTPPPTMAMPPVQDEDENEESQTEATQTASPAAKPEQTPEHATKLPKQPSNLPITLIFSTLAVMVLLAALAVYAYTKSQK